MLAHTIRNANKDAREHTSNTRATHTMHTFSHIKLCDAKKISVPKMPPLHKTHGNLFTAWLCMLLQCYNIVVCEWLIYGIRTHNVCIGIPREYVIQWRWKRRNHHRRCHHHDQREQQPDSDSGKKLGTLYVCLPDCYCHCLKCHTMHTPLCFWWKSILCVLNCNTLFHTVSSWSIHKKSNNDDEMKESDSVPFTPAKKEEQKRTLISTRIFECESHFPCEREKIRKRMAIVCGKRLKLKPKTPIVKAIIWGVSGCWVDGDDTQSSDNLPTQKKRWNWRGISSTRLFVALRNRWLYEHAPCTQHT